MDLIQSNVIKNIALVGVMTLVFKVISFFKEALIAANFGLSELLDTFLIATLIPGYISNVFIGSFKNVFIPNYVAETHAGNPVGRFQGTGFLVTFFVSTILVVLAFLFTDVFLELLFPGHTESYYDLIKQQFYFVMPCIILWGFSSLMGGILNINDEFKWTSIGPLFAPIVMIVCLFFFREEMGNMVLAIGTLIGTIIAFVYYIIISIWKKTLAPRKPIFKGRNVRLMFGQIPAKMSSALLTGLHNVMDAYFAAQLVVGSVSALNYGKKIPAFAVGILVISMSSVLLPYFSKLVVKDINKAFNTLFNTIRYLFFGAVAIAVVGILFSEFIVDLLFERQAFTKENTEIVANIQKIILIYLPFTICGRLLVNFLTSINKNNFMALLSLISVILNLTFILILYPKYGIYGIATATTLIFIIRSIILYIYTIKQRRLLTTNAST